MDAGSVALFVLVVPHLIGAAFLAWWILPATARDELRGWFRDDGGGTRPSGPPSAPAGDGGRSLPPLPDAAPSAFRMREPGRLHDAVPSAPRRPAHPARPADPERRRAPVSR